MGRAPVIICGNKLCFSSRSGKDILLHENNHGMKYKEFKEIKVGFLLNHN